MSAELYDIGYSYIEFFVPGSRVNVCSMAGTAGHDPHRLSGPEHRRRQGLLQRPRRRMPMVGRGAPRVGHVDRKRPSSPAEHP